MTSTLSLTALLFRRDWRGGELRLLFVAVLVAVAALASVGFFVDRMKQALTLEARQLLGADSVVSSDTPLSPALFERAKSMGLTTGQTVVFPSMVTFNGRTQLASVKAVTANYPLRGRLRMAVDADKPMAGDQPVGAAPGASSAWADPQLFQALGARGKTNIELGETQLTIDGVLTYEPDRGVSFVNFAPRLMISMQALEASRLIQPASRVTYRLLVAGDPAAVKRFETDLKLERGQRIESLENGRPELRSTLDRAEKFLALVSLLTALLAAVAIALAARQFAQRHIDGCAVMKTMGLGQSRLQRALVGELLLVGVGAGLVGSLLGWGLHFALISAIAGFLQLTLPAASWTPVLQSVAAGLVLLMGFGAWPFLRLAGVPPLRVLRRDLGVAPVSAWLAPVLAAISFAALMYWFAGDRKLATLSLLGFAAGALVFALAAYVAVRLLSPLRAWLAHVGAAPALRIALATWATRRSVTVVQTVALAVGLMALLLLTVTRNDLLDSWRRTTPPDAPNRFLINIQPDQKDEVAKMLTDSGVARPVLYPMVRGRLIAVNGKNIGPESFDDERASRLVDREFNLSYGATQPEHNQTIEGRWLDPDQLEVSAEQGMMQSLKLKLGDQLSFEVAGEPVIVKLVGVRKLSWDSMKVNFFMYLSPAALQSRPQTLITAYHQKPQNAQTVDTRLVQRFSNLTVFDTGNIVRQIQQMLEQVIRAVEILFVLTLAAGLVVLYAALASSRDERTREAGLMRALGATRRQLQGAQLLELGFSGALAGTLAAGAALAVGLVLARQVFQFEYQPQWLGLFGGLVLGAVAAMLAGTLGLLRVLRTPPIETLRSVT